MYKHLLTELFFFYFTIYKSTTPGAFNGGRGAPNFIQAKRNSWVVPKNPEFADTPGCLNMGPIGVAINGVPIYNPYTRNCCDAGEKKIIN